MEIMKELKIFIEEVGSIKDTPTVYKLNTASALMFDYLVSRLVSSILKTQGIAEDNVVLTKFERKSLTVVEVYFEIQGELKRSLRLTYRDLEDRTFIAVLKLDDTPILPIIDKFFLDEFKVKGAVEYLKFNDTAVGAAYSIKKGY